MGRISENFGLLYLGAVAAIYLKPEYTISSSRAATIALLFAIITIPKVIYQLFLYPAFFTSLKHIQGPGVSGFLPLSLIHILTVRQGRHWWRGNGTKSFLETPYDRIREWMKVFPDEGMIRYYVVGNLERVVLTSTKALSELLVTKVYDFEKPRTVQQQLRRVVGDGILLAEGETHKVWFGADG